jgi:transketolase
MSRSSATSTPMSEPGLDTVAELAAQVRVDSIRSSTSAGSGHPTSSMSAADEPMASRAGIAYIRTTRGAYPVLYPAGETFPMGGSKVLRFSDRDDVTLVGAGVTLHACLRAAETLQEEGIRARVIDCYSIKPIDGATLAAAAATTSVRIVVAEDHRPEGGLVSAVAESLLAARATSLSLVHLAERDMPGSGSGEELLAWAGIDAGHIAGAARRLLDRTTVVPA